MSDWQPIATAPKDGSRVLLFDKFCREDGFARFVGSWSSELGGYWYAIPGCFKKRPTHWMPLPGAPTA